MKFLNLNKIAKTSFCVLLLTSSVLLISGCGKPGNRGGRPSSNTETKAVPVITHITEPSQLKEFIKITGKLEGITDIALISETSGKVIEVHKSMGDWVEKDESIARIDNTDYLLQMKQAEANVLSAEASLLSTQMNYDAVKKLHENGTASDAEMAQAESSLKSAQAGLDGAKISLERAEKALDNSNFAAPKSGYISNITIEEGDLVNNGTMICNIVNSRKLIVRTGVGESNITKLKRGQEVFISHDLLVKEISGKITGLGIKPDESSASYPVEITLENPGKVLYPGMIIEGRILSETYENVIFTSLNNIKQQYDDNYVFVIQDNKAVKKAVKLGTQVEENVILESGIEPGEMLVIEGMDNLEDNVTVEVRK